MNGFWRDLNHALRMLVRKPAFTLVAVVTLALGIGANTAIFSVVNAVLLRPLSYPDADRLVVVSQNSLQDPDMAVSYPDYLDWRGQQTVFEEISARMPTGGVITGANEPERVIGRLVTPSFFSTLGVQPILGRGFTEAENSPGAPAVMVISHGLWQRQFGGADAIGKPITYNGEPWTVIGVMPPWFDYYGRANINNDLFTPLGRLRDRDFMQDRDSHTVRVTARLKPGVSIDQAASELRAVAARLASEYPSSNTGIGANVRFFLDDYVGDSRQALRVIFAAVAFMLLIACANVANLMLARATTRRKEIALRLALGASRWRIARQLWTESLVLAVVGGLFGVLLAGWGVSLLSKLNTGELSRMDEVSIDGRVLGFTLLISLSVGFLSGLLPALQNSRLSLNETLKEGNRNSSAGSGGRLRRFLVAAEVGLALMLLIGAGLVVRSFERLISVEPGFDPRNVLTFRLRLPDAKYRETSQALAFGQAAISRVSSLPGVESVAVSTGFPLGRASESSYLIEGQPELLPSRAPLAIRQDVSEDYHKTLQIGLVEGRLFTVRDTQAAPPVVIVDEDFAARNFPHQPAREVIGRRIRFGGEKEEWREIVGIVRHVKQSGLNEIRRAQIYRPLTQMTSQSSGDFARATDMLVKTSVDPYSLIGAIKKEIQAIDKDQPIAQIQTLEDKLNESFAPQRFTLLLLGIFALTALLLASAGIYAVMSYAVTQRTHEIGVRMALGARQFDVLKLMVGQGMILVVMGVSLGLVGALASTRLMTALLFEVSAKDPVTFTVLPLVLFAVALLACFLPARRATKVDPLIALRYE